MANFKTALMASALVAAWALPASAADLPIPPPNKAEQAQAPKNVRHHPTRIAAAGWLPTSAGARGWFGFPIVIGVAY